MKTNSKFKKAWQQAKDTYNFFTRTEAKVKIVMEVLVRNHHPQEDVDTIRSMISVSMVERNGGQLYDHDNCFHVQSTETPRLEKDYQWRHG